MVKVYVAFVTADGKQFTNSVEIDTDTIEMARDVFAMWLQDPGNKLNVGPSNDSVN